MSQANFGFGFVRQARGSERPAGTDTVDAVLRNVNETLEGTADSRLNSLRLSWQVTQPTRCNFAGGDKIIEDSGAASLRDTGTRVSVGLQGFDWVVKSSEAFHEPVQQGSITITSKIYMYDCLWVYAAADHWRSRPEEGILVEMGPTIIQGMQTVLPRAK